MRYQESQRTESQIYADVLQKLHWEPRVNQTEMEVQLSGPVYVCFSGQEDAGTREEREIADDMEVADEMEIAEGVTRGGARILCDGPGCRSESQQVDGWLFVSSGGEHRHYCRACLVGYLDRLRGQSSDA